MAVSAGQALRCVGLVFEEHSLCSLGIAFFFEERVQIPW